MAVRLRDELEAAGYEGTDADFRSAIAKLHRQLHEGWTDEELVFHPKEAFHFCNILRKRLKLDVPDALILRTLVNYRKRGDKKADQASGAAAVVPRRRKQASK